MKNPIIFALMVALALIAYNIATLGPDTMPLGNPKLLGQAGLREIDVRGPFKPESLAVKGLPTVFVFCTKRCPGCRLIFGDHIPKLLAVRPDVAVRKITLPDNWSAQLARQTYDIGMHSTPHIVIVSPDGTLFKEDGAWSSPARDYFYDWLNREVRQDWEEKMKKSRL